MLEPHNHTMIPRLVPLKSPLPYAGLLNIGTCAVLLRIQNDQVIELVECGEIRWVVSVGIGQRRHCGYRIWARELWDQPACDAGGIDALMKDIFGSASRCRYRGIEFVQAFAIARPTLQQMCNRRVLTSRIQGHTRWIPRTEIERFLKSNCLALAEPGLPRSKTPLLGKENPSLPNNPNLIRCGGGDCTRSQTTESHDRRAEHRSVGRHRRSQCSCSVEASPAA